MNGMRPHDPKCHGWTETLQRAAKLIAQGHTNREMGTLESVTEYAAKEQVRRVREHLRLDYRADLLTRGDLMRFWRELGFG